MKQLNIKLITSIFWAFAMTAAGYAQKNVEVKGYLLVEAEDFDHQSLNELRSWYKISKDNLPAMADEDLLDGASGEGYIEILPDTRKGHDDKLVPNENFCNEPGKMVVISYDIQIQNPGRYFVWVKTHSTGTEDNGVHVGLDGDWPASGARMQWCNGKGKWTWASKQRTGDQHCGVEKMIYLDIEKGGPHQIMFSMREDGFSMDQWAISREYINPGLRK